MIDEYRIKPLSLLARGAVTATTNGTAISIADERGLLDVKFLVHFPAATTASGTDYLTFSIQQSVDGGTTWEAAPTDDYRWESDETVVNDIVPWDGKIDDSAVAGEQVFYQVSFAKSNPDITHIRPVLTATGSPDVVLAITALREHGLTAMRQRNQTHPLRSSVGEILTV